MSKPNLGIERLHSLEIAVHEAAPWLSYMTAGFGFQHIAVTTGQAVEQCGTRRHLLACASLRMVIAEPVHAGSPVRRYLEKHPEGISRINFAVADARKAADELLERNATPISDIQNDQINRSEWKSIAIATPIGDVEFAFIERSDKTDVLMPGMEPIAQFNPDHNPIGLTGFDHLTANMRTLMPTIAFYEHVMGMKRCWDVQFHTEDVRPGIGSGLKSIVMFDENSGIKIASNEPLRPRFENSQVQLYVDLNRGPGFQHVAFSVKDVVAAVDHSAAAGVTFLQSPPSYYQALPARLKQQAISELRVAPEELARRGILVDGDRRGYLMQIFCQDQVTQFRRANCGPVFFELVERCGSLGFGEGNFRALFDAMQQNPSAA